MKQCKLIKPRKDLTWQQNFWLFVMQTEDVNSLYKAPKNLNEIVNVIFKPTIVFKTERDAELIKDYFTGLSLKDLSEKYQRTTGRLLQVINNNCYWALRRAGVQESLKSGKLVGFSVEDSLYNLPVNAKIINALGRNGITDINKLCQYTPMELVNLRGFGYVYLQELEMGLATTKYHLKTLDRSDYNYTEIITLRQRNKELEEENKQLKEENKQLTQKLDYLRRF